MSTQVQCPNCSGYKTKLTFTYFNRKTQLKNSAQGSLFAICLFGFGCVAPFLVAAIRLKGENVMYWFILAAIIIWGFIVYYLNLERRRMIQGKSKLYETHYIYHCKMCGYQWEVPKPLSLAVLG